MAVMEKGVLEATLLVLLHHDHYQRVIQRKRVNGVRNIRFDAKATGAFLLKRFSSSIAKKLGKEFSMTKQELHAVIEAAVCDVSENLKSFNTEGEAVEITKTLLTEARPLISDECYQSLGVRTGMVLKGSEPLVVLDEINQRFPADLEQVKKIFRKYGTIDHRSLLSLVAHENDVLVALANHADQYDLLPKRHFIWLLEESGEHKRIDTGIRGAPKNNFNAVVDRVGILDTTEGCIHIYLGPSDGTLIEENRGYTRRDYYVPKEILMATYNFLKIEEVTRREFAVLKEKAERNSSTNKLKNILAL
jgi:hypothetical protein